MHVNPCGRAVDWIQFPFEVDARLHDSADAPLVRLRWVYTDQPFLPPDFQNKITNRIWNADQHSEEIPGMLPVGENHYRQDARWILFPFAFADHMCHSEWMVTGEPWPVPPTLPPTVYLAGWVPECCVMACDATECRREPVNDEPASQVTQYAIPAVEATDATPGLRQFVTDAEETGGGNWHAAGQRWFPQGTAGPVGYQVTNLADPNGDPFSRVEQFQFTGGNVFEEEITALARTWSATVGGVSGALTMQPLGLQMQLTGSNLVIAPAVLPSGIVYAASGVVLGSGTTQAGATQLTRGVWNTFAAGAGDDAFVLVAGVGAVIDVRPSGAIPTRLFPPVGEQFFGNVPNGHIFLDSAGPPYFMWRFVRFETGIGGTVTWAVEKLRADGTEPAGAITSVGIGTSSGGVTVGSLTIGGAVALSVDIDGDLSALAALSGTHTIYYRSAANTWTAVTIGSYLDFTGATLKAVIPTATHGETAGVGFAITGASGVYQATGITFTLPDAGTYQISAKIRGEIQPGAVGNHFITAKLVKVSGTVDVANSETMICQSNQNGVLVTSTSALVAQITVAGPTAGEVYEIYAKRNGTTWTSSQIVNDANGRTVVDWVKLA